MSQSPEPSSALIDCGAGDHRGCSIEALSNRAFRYRIGDPSSDAHIAEHGENDDARPVQLRVCSR
jgi:hypothetical protein